MSTARNIPVDPRVYGGMESIPPRKPPRALWKSILRWIVAIIGILAIIIAIAIPVLLHNHAVHQYVLRTAREKASANLGAPVEIHDFKLAFSGINPTLDLFDVRVHGRAPYTDPPLFELNHARVGLTIVSLLKKTWYLNDVQLHQPVVRVFVDKHGNTNLPQPPKKNDGKSQTNIFDLGIRHAVLDGGELYYNNEKSAMDADLHDLQLLASYDAAQRTYSGTLGYRDGHLKLEKYNTIPHDLSARFSMTEQQVMLESATLRSGRSNVNVSATVDGYTTPTPIVNARYRATIDSTEFRRILKNASMPIGSINLAGTLEYHAQPNVPALKAALLKGTLSSPRLELRSGSLRTEVENIAGAYSFANGDAELRKLRANVLGGSLVANATVKDLTGASRSRVTATLENAQLARVQTFANSSALKQVSLTGGVNADLKAAWGKTFADLAATANARVNGSVAPHTSPNARVPVDSVIHARYNGRSKEVTLANSYVRLPSTSLTLNGTVSDKSVLQVNLQANDLHELESIAELFRTPTPGQPSPALGLYGSAVMNATVKGSTSAPQINGHLAASNLRVKGSAWRSLKTDIAASPTMALLSNGELTAAKQGRIKFALQAGLNKWKYSPTSPFQARINASSLDAAELARLAGSQAQISGILNASADLRGSQQDPVGRANVALSKAVLAGEPVQSLQLRTDGDGNQLDTIVELRLPAGAVTANLTYMPQTRAYTADVRSPGIRLEQLQTVKARNLGIAGVLNLSANGRGTLDDPALNASINVPQLRLKDQTISNISLQTNVANHLAKFALNSSVLNNAIRGQGTVALTGDYVADATIDTPRIQLQPLVAAFMPAQAGNVSGETELHATLRGPLKRKDKVEAHITLPVLAMNYKKTFQLAAAEPIRLDYANGIANLQRTAIRGTGTDLQLQAVVPVAGKEPLSLLALGTVDLSVAQLFVPDITSSGQLRFNINSFGSSNDPNVQGRIEIVNANVTTPGTPVGLENGNGVLTLTNNRLNISKFTGTVGGGSVSAGGGISYRPSLAFDLALHGEGVRMLVPPGVRTGVGINLALNGTPTAAVLRGTVNIAQLSFTPDFDFATLMGGFGGTISAPPGQGFTDDLQLDLSVVSTGGINLVSRDLSLQGNAALHVRGTAAEPVVLGRVTINGGDLIFRGNRYVLQAGTIDFVNPTRTQPLLNVAVDTTIKQYDIAMRFQGPIDKMRTSYTSDPALPPSDIINLLAFGKTSEAAAANPNPPGTLGAQSSIASAVSGQVTNRIEKIAGISNLSVDPTLGGTGRSNATITVQQRVTGKLFVTFSTDITGYQRVVQLEYQPNRRTKISGTRDQNGGFAIDTRFQRSW